MDISNAAEAIRALCCIIPGFEDEIKKGQYRVVRIYPNGDTVDTEQDLLHFGLGKISILRIIPVAAGNKSGFFQVILGIVLVGAAFLLTGGALSATAFTAFGTAVTGSQLALVGGLLAISGVSALMAPEIKQDPEDTPEKPSFMISSPANHYEQGHPVAWNFGKRFFIGSVAISNGIAVEDFN